MPQPDPELFMLQFCSWEVATRENKWQGRNCTRWRNDDYDRAYRAAESELDPVKRAAHFIRMNDVLVQSRNVIPLVNRPVVSAHSNRLRAPMSGWDIDVWLLKDWYKEA
jgi:peptide/nickel transport system substrate-binding protein